MLLQDRIALAMQWGWPTIDQRTYVVNDSQGKSSFSELKDKSQRLILNWEHNPRRSPIGEVDLTLRKEIKKARLAS
jgi:hypothetical protein